MSRCLHNFVIIFVLLGIVVTGSKLLKHKTSSLFLSLNPKDNFLYLHPYNCRSFKDIFWTLDSNQEIQNDNGKVVKFMSKDEFDALTDKNGEEVADTAVYIPTTKDTATISSSSFDFDTSTNVIKITIANEEYILNPSKFPKVSYLSQSGEDSSEMEMKTLPGFI